MKNRNFKGPWLIAIAALLLVAAMLILGNLSFKATEKATFNEFNRRQLVLARETIGGIELYFWFLAEDIKALGQTPQVQSFDEVPTRREIQQLFDKLEPLGANDIGVLDANGILRYNVVAPEIEGVDFSWRKYYQEAKEMTANDTYIIEFIEFKGAEAGQKGVLVAVPMFESATSKNPSSPTGPFAGVIICTLKLDTITQKFIAPVHSSERGHAFLIDDEYNLLWGADRSLLGENLLAKSEGFPAFQQIVKRMGAGNTGTEEYSYYKLDEAAGEYIGSRYTGDEEEKLIAYAPIHLGQELWAIGVWAPKEDAHKLIHSAYLNQLLVVGLSLLTILGGSTYTLVVFSRIGRMLEQEVVTKTGELKEYITERKRVEEALRESEERYRHMFQTASVSLWEEDISHLKAALDDLKQQGITDFRQYLDENPDFVQQAVQMIKVLDVNDLTLQLFGAKNKDELLGSLNRTVAPEAIPDFKEQIVAIAEQKPYFQRESFAQTLQGKRLNILLSVTIPPATTKFGTMLVSIMDITERKQAEATLRRYAERLKILHQIDQGIQVAQSSKGIVGTALSHIRQLVHCQRASVVTFDYEAGQVSILADDAGSDIEPMEQTRFGFDEFGIMAELRQGKVYVITDILTYPEPPAITQIMSKKELRSFISVPLFAQDQLIGSLNLGSATPNAFSPEYIDIAREVADPLAVAITQARLREQVQRHTEELEQLVVDRTRELSVLYEVTAAASESLDLQTTLAHALKRVLAAMKSNAGVIHLLAEVDGTAGKKRLNLAAQQGLPPDLVAQIDSVSSGRGLGKRILESGEPLIISDVASDPRLAKISGSPQMYVGLPMRARGGVTGILSIFREAGQPQFNVEELTLLTSVADQIGVVVESVQLRRQAEQAAVLEERARLARELHDSVTQLLYSMKLFARSGQNAYRLGDLNEMTHCLSELEDGVQQALKEMRLLIYELRPPVLEQDGLIGALEHRLEAVEERAGVSTQLLMGQMAKLPGRVEKELYHIAIEALNNALKHAKAASIIVSIDAAAERVNLEVTDDGAGFDLDAVTGKGGLGLIGIRERTEKLGGQLTILSTPGKGTTVKVDVALEGTGAT